MSKWIKRLPAIAAGFTTIAGVIASPAVAAIVPAKWAAVITAVGAVAQALTHSVTHTPESVAGA